MMGQVLGRRRWWATRLVGVYAVGCAVLAAVEIFAVHPPEWVGPAVVFLTLPTSMLVFGVFTLANMTIPGFDGSSVGWMVTRAVVCAVALAAQTLLLTRLIFDGSRTVRATRATKVLDKRVRAAQATSSPVDGPTVRL
jgi:hypothetical protein